MSGSDIATLVLAIVAAVALLLHFIYQILKRKYGNDKHPKENDGGEVITAKKHNPKTEILKAAARQSFRLNTAVMKSFIEMSKAAFRNGKQDNVVIDVDTQQEDDD